ncbi:ABC1 kinase family protein [Allocoleopsis franciscana]|uniref:Putative unusual protein kinase n=1 Tax=Allocoleopsis franciscana PCC 7113 TaxID=1173027 RepID=K9WLU7_9CYAN|nr:AarF/ABC1/UbiB kinase family protein [Allocoleopsis franciscana]AFZ21143.1 putative unusual protein kinase [Allocoleopsis franciscana PCC 7113]
MLTPTVPKPLRWQRARYSPLARQIDIFASALNLMFYLWWDKVVARNSPHHRNRRAQWLVGTLLDLGPTFIKIGQALSTRADLLPREYVQALGQLQDRVPPFGSAEAIALIESELGNSIHTLYRDFDPYPLASASLGQVHKARLHTGEDVVVKVQRPGLERLFNLDFEVLHRLVRFLERLAPSFRKYDLEAIYHEFFELLYKEIDYIHEGKNADGFRVNFTDYPRIIVPKIYWRYTTKKVLTLEYLPGIKIDDRQTMEACGINTKEIIQLGICCYLKQLLQDGFFQSDPHPGNMAVSQDGHLIFYDFGTMTEVKPIAKDQMIKTFFAVLRKDTDEVIDTLTYMGLIEPVPDMTPVRRLIAFTLEKFREKPVELQAFDQMRSEIYAMFEQQPFRLPAQMTFILKSITTLDGIARTLDPEYNLLSASKPFIKSLTVSKQGRGNVVGELARQAKDFIQYKLRQPNATEILLRRLEERLEQGEIQFNVRAIESERALKRINLAIKCLMYACLAGFTLLSGTVLLGTYSNWAIAAFAFSGFWFLILLRSLIKLAVRERLDNLSER